jgi:menaquinol-cytochrome c reductase iron-sulfur subunit
MYAIWGAITASLSVPALAYLFLPPKARKDESWIDVGDITRLTPNQPVEMTFRRNRTDGWKVISEKVTAWVVKTPEGGVSAFGPQCTHLGCAHHWDENRSQFVCPCHNSLFSIEGKVTYGPAPRPLDRYEAKISGNKLLLGDLRPSAGNSV